MVQEKKTGPPPRKSNGPSLIPIYIQIAASYHLRRDSELDSEGVY